MIAIKQAKFKPSNKIQENQIKNITSKPSNVAQQTNDDDHNHHDHHDHQQQQQLHLQNHNQHNQNQVISSNDNYSCPARLAREQKQDGPAAAAAAPAVKSTTSDNNHQRQQLSSLPHHHHHHQTNNNNYHQQQQQSNATRSETREKIDGATTASAAPTKSSTTTTAPPQPTTTTTTTSTPAATTLATLPSSTATTSSLSTAASPTASTPPMAVKQARQLQRQQQQQQPPPHQQPATSLTTASAKIQQRQQKFLAAAARSATSPQCHLDQNLSVIKQQQQQQQARTTTTSSRAPAIASCADSSESCCSLTIDKPPATASVVDVPPPPPAPASAARQQQQQPQPPMTAADDCTWCQPSGAPIECNQCIMQQASDASLADNTRGGATVKTAVEKSCNSAATNPANADNRRHNQSQQMIAPGKRQTVPLLATPCKSDATMARTKVLSMASAMMSGERANGSNLKTSDGVNSKLQQQQRGVIDNDQYRSTLTKSCASLDAVAATAIPSDSCGTTATTANAAAAANANAGVSNVGDIACNRGPPARPPLSCDGNNLATGATYRQQVSSSPIISQQRLVEVRQQSSGEQQHNDDNINIKNTTTTKHNNHYHYHHYYNQNYLNFHRFQHQQHQQQQHHHPHQNYFHLQQQQQQQQQNQRQQQTTNNSSTTTTTTPTTTQQPVMAHYKFHNDCQSSVLTYEQVKRLDFVMDQTVPIHGRGNTPTLYVKLKELIRLVKYKLQHEHSIEIRDVRLNGGAASYVLAPENSKYNDLDLVFGTDLSNEDRFDVIRDVVLDCLMEFYTPAHHGGVGGDGDGADQTQADIAQHGHHKSTLGDSGSLRINGSNIELSGGGGGGGGGNDMEEDDDDDHPASRSNRSSSFESDNLNVTTNELDDDDASDGSEEDDDDEEDDVIVRIDSDDTGCGDLDSKNEELDGATGHRVIEIQAAAVGDTSDLIEHSQDTHGNTPVECKQGDAVEQSTLMGYEASQQQQQQYPYLGYQQYHHHHQYNQMPPNNININNNCAFKEAYVHKMVKVNDDDRWSLISLGVQQSETQMGGHDMQQASAAAAAASGCNNQQQQQQQQTAPGSEHTSTTATNWCDSFASQQQKQLPNSIELKFVDKMRRKFEFSVDSFQIILDSLIQFYDYAPQSTITIQRKNTRVGDSIFNANPLMGLSHCLQCDRGQAARMPAVPTEINSIEQQISSSSSGKCKTGSQSTGKKYAAAAAASRTHCETTSLSDHARSFYELPLDPGNSLSNSSVASSSGCSSSSSVVSSSSSSLSCDEDQEDLYCDVDNSPSSSASTSSLLSSTTTTSGTASPCVASLLVDESSKLSQQQKHQNHNVISSGGQQHNNYRGQRNQHHHHHEQQAAVAYQVPNSISTSNFDSKHVNIRASFTSENLCDFGTTTTTTKTASSTHHRISSCAVISENFYPTVIGRSEYGNFKEALYHLEKKLIATRSPEEIRGGGLLKYCNLLVKNYKPTNVYQIRTLERYMCSRFFIDFSDLNQQRAKLESYLANHFSDDAKQKFDYLTILHNVVQRSTVCLMNHELRLTLNMIRELAYNLPQQQQQQQQHNQSQAAASSGQVQQQQLAAADHQRSPAEKQGHFYQQQKPTTMQSGVYRVKLVNYALAKPVRS